MARRVRLLLYSILREIAGSREVLVEAPEGASVGLVLEMGLGNALVEARSRGIQIIVMDSRGRRLGLDEIVDTDTLHVMPPPSGGGSRVMTGLLEEGDDPNSVIARVVEELASEGMTGETGAVVIFVGVVRRINKGYKVKKLVYEVAREPATAVLARLAEEYYSRPGVSGVAAYHYVGERAPGDVTMIVAVAARSRSEAIPVLAELVDRIKHEVPIWKREDREEGSVYIIGDREEPAS